MSAFDRPVRIAMWSGPRNISTTMMRAFENRPDCAVVDEPFYAAYLSKTGLDHPYRDEILAAQPPDRTAVAKRLAEDQRAPVIFEKHISHHMTEAPDGAFLSARRNFILIRDPRAMAASYADRFDDATPVIHALAIQRAVFDALAASGAPCPVVDASDILKDPAGRLRRLCESLGVPFTEAMLAWPPGPRDSDGVWGAHWYEAVWASDGFKPFREKKIELSEGLEAIANACGENYDYLHSQRLN